MSQNPLVDSIIQRIIQIEHDTNTRSLRNSRFIRYETQKRKRKDNEPYSIIRRKKNHS